MDVTVGRTPGRPVRSPGRGRRSQGALMQQVCESEPEQMDTTAERERKESLDGHSDKAQEAQTRTRR